jgi:hypothetical protein
MRGPKTKARLALAVYFDAQACAAAIALIIALNRTDLAERYALAGKQIAYHVAFVGTLGIDIQMLQIATTAVAEMRARRLNTLLGGGEQ